MYNYVFLKFAIFQTMGGKVAVNIVKLELLKPLNPPYFPYLHVNKTLRLHY